MPTTKTIFCADCQASINHTMALDKNKEIIAICDSCKRVIKFPKVTSPSELRDLFAKHKQANAGQISAEALAQQDAIAQAEFNLLMEAE